jgi:hypothetical protein
MGLNMEYINAHKTDPKKVFRDTFTVHTDAVIVSKADLKPWTVSKKCLQRSWLWAVLGRANYKNLLSRRYLEENTNLYMVLTS